ncbi:hypothetical protein GQ42DRAFT_34861 [Ramicandelaber brevisporus]|nr:hypothetical protein GQ42DRAFT_34861 [Ramicandelaber brevisporus]
MVNETNVDDFLLSLNGPQHEAADKSSKTFYDDLRLAQDATQRQVLDAAVAKFFELFDDSHEEPRTENGPHVFNSSEVEARSCEVYAPFMTLYKPAKRAAYDMYGDGLFGLLGRDSHADATHPSTYYTPTPGLVSMICGAALLGGAVIFGSLWGVVTGDYTAGYFLGFAVSLPLLMVVCNYPLSVRFPDRIGQAVALVVGLNIATNRLPMAVSFKRSIQARVYGLRVLWSYLPGIFSGTIFIALMVMYIYTYYPEFAEPFAPYGILLFSIMCLIQIILSLVHMVESAFIPRRDLRVLFQAVRKRADTLSSDELDDTKRKYLMSLLKTEALPKGSLSSDQFYYYLICLGMISDLKERMVGSDGSLTDFVEKAIWNGSFIYVAYILGLFTLALTLSRVKRLFVASPAVQIEAD